MDYSNIGDRTEGGHEGKTAKKAEQIIISVCGVKNSGKTTLLAGIVKELIKRGKKPAVIKHDGHDFSCDVLGTDMGQQFFQIPGFLYIKQEPGRGKKSLYGCFRRQMLF